MNFQGSIKLLRTRWITIVVTTIGIFLGAAYYTYSSPAIYEASTRLFVTTSAPSSLADLYEGGRFSQERVLSYTELLMGRTIAQRAIDKLGLNMSADSLAGRINALSKPNTVIIYLSVRDESPARARDIANALSDEFVLLVRELETHLTHHARPDAGVIVEQRAELPRHPVLPKTGRNIAAGLIGGLLIGVGLAVVRDRLDNTVKDQKTLEAITHVRVVGNIPFSKERCKAPAISFHNDNSDIAEAFRTLRTNLQFRDVYNPPRLIVVTSSIANEGKSTTTINIALALAEKKHNVVLVDGDIRHTKLAKYSGLNPAAGFSTVLSGNASLSEVLQKTKLPHLTVLTSGTPPPDPSELLGSSAAKEILRELRAHFDYVIVDSSPLLTVTDGAILAAYSDGALITTRFGWTKRQQIAQAIERLENVGAPLLGAVLTMTPTRHRFRRRVRMPSTKPAEAIAEVEMARPTARNRHASDEA